MTPEDLKSAQTHAMLSNSVYPTVKGDLDSPPRATLPGVLPPGYTYIPPTDFANNEDKRLKGLQEKDFKDKDSHFFAGLFRNKDGKYELSIQGSQTMANHVSNANQLRGLEDAQYTKAMQLGDKLKTLLGDDFVGVTGHSKGGGQAAAVSMVTGVPAWTYNAAGLNPATIRNFKPSGGTPVEWKPDRIANFSVNRELVTDLQRDYGSWTAAGRQTDMYAINDKGELEPSDYWNRQLSTTLHRPDWPVRALGANWYATSYDN